MLNVYLSGEIHTDWRNQIIELCKDEKLDIKFSSPITNHDFSEIVVLKFLEMKKEGFGKITKVQK